MADCPVVTDTMPTIVGNPKMIKKISEKIVICFLTDKVARGDLRIEYCSTKAMLGDIYTKPLQGEAFTRFRDQILGLTPIETSPSSTAKSYADVVKMGK